MGIGSRKSSSLFLFLFPIPIPIRIPLREYTTAMKLAGAVSFRGATKHCRLVLNSWRGLLGPYGAFYKDPLKSPQQKLGYALVSLISLINMSFF